MQTYSPVEVAEILNRKTSTIRKYSLLLEKYQYDIKRNDKNHRRYTDNDVMILRSVITGVNNGTTLDKAVRTAVTMQKHDNANNGIEKAGNVTLQQHEELKQIIHKQNELIHQLYEQQSNILEELKQLKQIEAPAHKKGLFSRLFNK